MSAIFEVWDTETAHQVGTFASPDEAVAVLRDVLGVNGPEVAREMLVLKYSAPGARPVTYLEGAAFVAETLGATVAEAASNRGAHGASSVRE